MNKGKWASMAPSPVRNTILMACQQYAFLAWCFNGVYYSEWAQLPILLCCLWRKLLVEGKAWMPRSQSYRQRWIIFSKLHENAKSRAQIYCLVRQFSEAEPRKSYFWSIPGVSSHDQVNYPHFLSLCDRSFRYTSLLLFGWLNFSFSLSSPLRLNAHVSPSGTTCYITSNMFYVEVQLEMDGKVVDVKLAHLGDAPW